MTLFAACLFVLTAAASLGGPQTSQVEAVSAPVAVHAAAADPAVAALCRRVTDLEIKLAAAECKCAPVVKAAPEKKVVAVVRQAAYYERRAVYGPLGRFQGYRNVLVQPQAQSYGSCSGGNCRL